LERKVRWGENPRVLPSVKTSRRYPSRTSVKPLFLPYEYGGLSEPIRRQRNDIELGQWL